MYSKAYQDSIDAQQRAISLAPSVMQMGLAPAQTLGQVGMSEQARQQQAIDEARARFEFGQQAPQQALRQYSDIALGNMLPGSQTTSMSGGDPSFMQRAVGGTLLGLGTYGAGVSSGVITGAGANAAPGLVSNPVGASIAAALAVASLFD